MSRVRFKTTFGEFVVELDESKAPVTVENFLAYVRDGFYVDTIAHRVIPGFVVQMGGYDKKFNQKRTNAPIKNEWKNGLKNVRASLSMARTAKSDSATSQFFINLVDNDRLDEPISGGAAYAVFGKITEGMDVIDKIAAAPKRHNPSTDSDYPDPMLVVQSTTVE